MNRSSPHNTNANPTKRLAELVGQLAKVSAGMAELMSSMLCDAVNSPQQSVEPENDSTPMAQPASPERRKPASKAEVIASVKVARDIIGLHNQPVQIGTLFKEVHARGFTIDTSRPVLTYGARLRDNRKRVGLIYLQGFGWWPAERPYAPANYVPSNISRIGKHIV